MISCPHLVAYHSTVVSDLGEVQIVLGGWELLRRFEAMLGSHTQLLESVVCSCQGL